MILQMFGLVRALRRIIPKRAYSTSSTLSNNLVVNTAKRYPYSLLGVYYANNLYFLHDQPIETALAMRVI